MLPIYHMYNYDCNFWLQMILKLKLTLPKADYLFLWFLELLKDFGVKNKVVVKINIVPLYENSKILRLFQIAISLKIIDELLTKAIHL